MQAMKKGFTPEQIIRKLMEVEVLLTKGEKIEQVIRKLGVSNEPNVMVESESREGQVLFLA
jgi:hypothetical protein